MLLWTSSAHAESRVQIDEFQVSRWVTDNMQALGLPSIAAGIVGPNKTYYLESFGPAELDQPFLTGTLSAQVTHLAVYLLIADGKLSAADEVAKHVPGVPPGVTVEQLLQHKSGYRPQDGADLWSDRSIAQIVEGASPAAAGQMARSNTNAALLGAVVAKVAGKPYAEFVRERIFEPADMKSASASPTRPVNRVIGHQYLYGFAAERGEPEYGSAMVPAAFVWMSASDYARWMKLHLGAGVLDGKQVIAAQAIEQARDTAWFRGERGGVTVFEQVGVAGAFSSAVAFVPDRSFGVFVTVNLNVWEALAVQNIREGMLSPILGLPRAEATNLEYVLRLGLGVVVALVLLTFLLELMRWIAGKFPLRIARGERAKVGIAVGAQLAILFAVPQYFEMPLAAMVASQPDVAYAFLATMIVGSLRVVLTALNKSEHIRALNAADV